MKNIIVAYDKSRAIGNHGDLLWRPGEMKADMERFRTLTKGSNVVMGLKTLNSIGMALPGRRNIVLCRDESVTIPDVVIAHSFDEAYSLADQEKEIFIIGGGEIYKQSINDMDRIYATEIDAVVHDADTFFPEINDNWQKTSEKYFEADENNIYPYRFVTYERK